MRLFDRFKMAYRGAIDGFKGQGFNFRNWFGRTFGIDNSQLATNETIFSVVSRLSNTMASLPMKLYKEYDVQNTDVSSLLTTEPNPYMTGFELINQLEVSRNSTGNGYALIIRDKYMLPTEIQPLESSSVMPFINTDDNQLWYKVMIISGTFYTHNSNMLHVKHIHTPGTLIGISPLKVLKNALEYDKLVQEFSLGEMQKKESFVLTYAANVDSDKRQKVLNDFRQFYKENGGILFQEPGVTIDPIDKKYFASDTINSEKITRARVANVFNVPVSFLNENQGQGYSSNEQMMIQFTQMTLAPIIKQYEQEFNRKLLTSTDRKNGLYFKFNLGGLLRGDTAARTALYSTLLRTAGMTPNEVRRLEDLPPSSEVRANELWISGDMYPLGMDVTLRKASKGGEKSE